MRAEKWSRSTGARGREAVFRRVLQLLDQRLTPRPKVLRFGIAHVEAAEVAERVGTALIAAFRPRDCFVSLASGVLGTHAGPGAWAMFYQVEDGSRPGGSPGGTSGGIDAGQDRGLPRRGGPLGGSAIQIEGSDLLVLDLRRVNDATDFFVIATGTSDAHVRGSRCGARAAGFARASRAPRRGGHGGTVGADRFRGFRCAPVPSASRAFYQLERLWDDAPVALQDRGRLCFDACPGALLLLGFSPAGFRPRSTSAETR